VEVVSHNENSLQASPWHLLQRRNPSKQLLPKPRRHPRNPNR
jgi:hypothetical protein